MTCRHVSIVIPTLNAGTPLDHLLAAVSNQDSSLTSEIVAIDSGSTDGTLARLRNAGATVLEVPAGAFNHGDTRNQALARCRGDLAVLLVQDAVPTSRRWLSALIAPLLGDPLVAGTFARQVPGARASRVTAHYLKLWIAAQPEPRTVGPLTAEAFERMSPRERLAACAFDNVCSCVRVSIWREHPFAVTPIAEDLEWARDVLLAGYRLTYVPDAEVQHSHERPVTYELQRAYLVHQRLEALFGLTTVPTMRSLLRAVAATIPVNARLAAHEPAGRMRALLRAAALGVVQPLGQYLGARSARAGREFIRPRGV
jgi:rhamnosyltransferase